MAKIVLEVEQKELDTVLLILNNLKAGLINNIEIDKKRSYNTPKPIKKEPLQPVSLSGKYVDPQTFKERLKQQRMKKYGK